MRRLSSSIVATVRRFNYSDRRCKFVQELLGHANVSITLDTYSHMLPGMGSEAADAMGEALG